MRGTSDDPKAAGSGPSAEASERPEQNIGYDEAVKGAPLSDEERQRAAAESPLTPEEPVGTDPLLDD
jgi:hypothetical protein